MHKNYVLHALLACGEELESQKTPGGPSAGVLQTRLKSLVVLELNAQVHALVLTKL